MTHIITGLFEFSLFLFTNNLKIYLYEKVTLLIVACIATLVLQAQNLLVNPGFEQWVDGKPTGWIFDKTVATITPETTIAVTDTSLKLLQPVLTG